MENIHHCSRLAAAAAAVIAAVNRHALGPFPHSTGPNHAYTHKHNARTTYHHIASNSPDPSHRLPMSDAISARGP
ncbi:hypothetical protein G3M48_002342, partial [Beauveria asiatica]